MSEIINVPMSGQRSLATVTAEIRAYQDAARRAVLSYCIEIGRRLVEAKSMVSHGEWGTYLREELGFSQSTANNHMRLFEAYGADQMTLTGAAVKSQAFADLSYTQALALLALPSEEAREAFVETHDLTSMSTRELQEELRRRAPADEPTREELAGRLDDALNEIRDQGIELQSMKDKVRAAIEDRDKAEAGEDQEFQRANALKIERDKMQDQLINAQKERDTAQAASKKAADELAKAKAALDAAKRAETDTLKKLNEAVKNPKIPKDVLEKLRKEAEEAAEKRHKADYEDLDQARDKLSKAEAEAAKARQEAERLEKELRIAAPEVAEFKVLFGQAQQLLNSCIDAALSLPADRLAGGLAAVASLLDVCRSRVQDKLAHA